MRHYKIYLFISLITLVACEDFLEIEPETTLSTANFYENQTDFEQALVGAYAPLQPLYEEDWQINEMRSDNTHFIFDIANRGTQADEDLATFTVETNNLSLLNKWTNDYLIISRANPIINQIDDAGIDEDARASIRGQALFLRAFAYFDLVKTFGGVPLITSIPASYEETFSTRATAAEIYDQIITDASEAASLLAPSAGHPAGRVSAGAARTLLADVYMTLERWSDAEQALTPVLSMGYSLLPNYGEIFSPSNEGNAEMLFEVAYVDNTSQPLFSEFPYSFLPELDDPSVITGVGPAQRNVGGSFNIPTPDLLARYEAGDERLPVSVAYYTGPSPMVGVTYDQTPYIHKFQHPHSIPGQTGQNFPVYRYAEVLLMMAEIVNEQNRSGEALTYLNQVRNRAGLADETSTDQATLREAIMTENQIELAFENKRWHDLVRKGMAVSVMNAFGQSVINNPGDYYYPAGSEPLPNAFNVTENFLLYPIPVSEIILNSQLEQNPGY